MANKELAKKATDAEKPYQSPLGKRESATSSTESLKRLKTDDSSSDSFQNPNAVDEEGHKTLLSVEINERLKVEVGDFVLVKDENKYNEPLIGHIYDLYEDQDRNRTRFAYVCWFLRPWQTTHKINKSFYKNEVFKSKILEKIEISKILDKCIVYDFKTATTGLPRKFLEEMSLGTPTGECEKKSGAGNWDATANTGKKLLSGKGVYVKRAQRLLGNKIFVCGSRIFPSFIKEEKVADLLLDIVEYADGPRVLEKVKSVFACEEQAEHGDSKDSVSDSNSEADTQAESEEEPVNETGDGDGDESRENSEPTEEGRESSAQDLQNQKPNTPGVDNATSEQGAKVTQEFSSDVVALFPTDKNGRILWFATPPLSAGYNPVQHSNTYLEYLKSKSK
ncbi:Chromatin structure-remodeling complex subunit RSC1 [Zancudomyces culisetae]|uniref:Chromatin structure-remodeling complex subunit RSC1 n=1 Tax=Zancudomyces culisetae TaxID=1213189 RepID=A0A1R1PH14_ZANCU|nr:Chromatin structure-remodeling complex subunit RSC1 [Zancudomyces culisetae]|eukprot:OMH80203.1 Chromatin structure-remodeling complex subunit RSC1 [Zancudomyces culisetae]